MTVTIAVETTGQNGFQ